MTRKRAKLMDQRPLWMSCTEETAAETVSAAHGFLAARQNEGFCAVPGVHLGNVSLERAIIGK